MDSSIKDVINFKKDFLKSNLEIKKSETKQENGSEDAKEKDLSKMSMREKSTILIGAYLSGDTELFKRCIEAKTSVSRCKINGVSILCLMVTNKKEDLLSIWLESSTAVEKEWKLLPLYYTRNLSWSFVKKLDRVNPDFLNHCFFKNKHLKNEYFIEASNASSSSWLKEAMIEYVWPRCKKGAVVLPEYKEIYEKSAQSFCVFSSFDFESRKEFFKDLNWSNYSFSDKVRLDFCDFIKLDLEDEWIQDVFKKRGNISWNYDRNEDNFNQAIGFFTSKMNPDLAKYYSDLGFDFSALKGLSGITKGVVSYLYEQDPHMDTRQKKWFNIDLPHQIVQCVRVKQLVSHITIAGWDNFLFWFNQAGENMPNSLVYPDRIKNILAAPQAKPYKNGLISMLKNNDRQSYTSSWDKITDKVALELLKNNKLIESCSIEEDGVSVLSILKQVKPRILSEWERKILGKSLLKVKRTKSSARKRM